MAETVEALTIAYTEKGTETVRELGKEVLSKGAYATILYHYQDLDRATGEWGKRKARIERYRKRDGVYRSQNRFNISSAKQGRNIALKLLEWFPEEP